MKIDRNQIIGFILLFGLFWLWSVMNAPSEAELKEQKRLQDSIANAQQFANAPEDDTIVSMDSLVSETQDTLRTASRQTPAGTSYGVFANAASGTEKSYVLENDLIKVEFSNKGGSIRSVLLKEYDKLIEDAQHDKTSEPVRLLEDTKNEFAYLLPLNDQAEVRTSELYFEARKSGSSMQFIATGENGTRFIQEYTIIPGSYTLNYSIKLENGSQVLQPGTSHVRLSWTNYLDKIEINEQYERYYSTVYYKPVEDDPSYCSCRKSDVEEINERSLKWISHSNQFFNSSLIAQNRFGHGTMETQMLDEDSEDLKLLKSQLEIPADELTGQGFNMQFYIGPNDFENLMAFDNDLEDIIPFGSSIFGTINRWVIRPLFSALSTVFSNKGLVILLLTLIVKIVLFPLTYRMLYSQAKMGALKPELSRVREKHKDDQQAQQMETMKMYREYGVSPLGGCMPMVLQMPIWFALYRFFPAAIEFRQAGFLWANDLSSYDVLFYLPFSIPMYGDHVSLFTLLWAGTTLIYTYYNTRHMDLAATNPMMKYIQYFMPVMFLFFFNGYASGLTLYLFYSNVLNILQTVGSRRLLFDEEKLREELNLNKAKPKKKGGFQARLEKALQEQQRIAREKEQKKKSGGKK